MQHIHHKYQYVKCIRYYSYLTVIILKLHSVCTIPVLSQRSNLLLLDNESRCPLHYHKMRCPFFETNNCKISKIIVKSSVLDLPFINHCHHHGIFITVRNIVIRKIVFMKTYQRVLSSLILTVSVRLNY